jgi:hypothetical protein
MRDCDGLADLGPQRNVASRQVADLRDRLRRRFGAGRFLQDKMLAGPAKRRQADAGHFLFDVSATRQPTGATTSRTEPAARATADLGTTAPEFSLV